MRIRLPIYSLALAVACGGDGSSSDTAAGATSIPAGATAGMEHSSVMDADQGFLRMMVDHHEGLVQMATAAMTKASRPATQGDAHNLHTKQAAERDSMLAILRTAFEYNHSPTVMRGHKSQNDSLQALSGAQYDRTFYRMIVDHHREGILMIDSLLPRLARPDVKRMAETMKVDHQNEIRDFQAKARSD